MLAVVASGGTFGKTFWVPVFIVTNSGIFITLKTRNRSLFLSAHGGGGI